MVKTNRRFRPALMTSVALAGLVLGNGAAHAEDLRVAAGPVQTAEEDSADQQAQNARFLINAADAVLERHNFGTNVTITPTQPDPNILIALPGTPTTARDATNITGIAQMVIDNGGGGVGLCTGTLINPRTVLFAAHCVNSRAATAYGANSGGTAIAFGFETNTRANAAGQTDELVQWLFGTGPNATGRYQTNTAQSFFNVEAVAYNPLSLEPAARSFLYGDVAIAALDTPARGIPTWALMFSPLTAPASINAATGTGYHVTLAGYGGRGDGASGNIGIDFRRRTAENWLGAVTSLFNFETFLFGGSNSPTQNVYFLDFDDPARGTSAASGFDFNAFRDNALPREGITAGGDSGGPLILDQAYARQLVIGVLSGGYTRFFSGQPANSYGTVSFYQPLYLYWDWIAANNPYRYVSANAGNGNWEDATRWVSLTDPNYFIIGPNGQLVNGVPSLTGEEKDGTSNQFGQACFQNTTSSQCLDFRTGVFTSNSNPIGTADGQPTIGLSNNAGSALISDITGATNQPGSALVGGNNAVLEPQKVATPLPPATIANGLPGATNFVPNNTPGNRLNGVLPRYFDVTLSNTGTTTLSSAVTIDRLTITGSAGLTIASAGSLNSLIDITQRGGTTTVTGALATPGDYLLASGLLQGTGRVTTPFLTSIAGTIAPGTVGTIGTLSITGNLILASASLTHIDISGTTSDLIAVTGAANVGGVVSVGTGVAGQVNGLGRQFTILTATGGVTGTFTAGNLTPILSQQFTYQPNAVLMQIRAASYATVIDTTNPVQAAYAQLLDQNRSNAALSSLYALDFTSTDTIRSTLNGLAPVNEQAVRSLASQTVNVLQSFNATRLREADVNSAGGKVAITGRPLELAQMSLSPMGQPLNGSLMALQDGGAETETTDANLPDNIGVFLSGGFINGDIAALPGYTTTRKMDGYYIAGGVEYFPSDATVIGVSGYYNSIDADTPLNQAVSSSTYAGSVYFRHKGAGGLVVDGQVSLGSLGLDTTRTVQFLGASQTLTSSSDDQIFSGALGISYDLKTGVGTLSPGLEARYASVDLSTVQETGGNLGLAIARDKYKSSQLRFGLDWEKKGEMLGVIATSALVWEFQKGPTLLGANFATGTGPNANFALRGADQTWGEVGIAATLGNGPLQFSAGFDTTIGRTDADAQVIRGSATYRF